METWGYATSTSTRPLRFRFHHLHSQRHNLHFSGSRLSIQLKEGRPESNSNRLNSSVIDPTSLVAQWGDAEGLLDSMTHMHRPRQRERNSRRRVTVFSANLNDASLGMRRLQNPLCGCELWRDGLSNANTRLTLTMDISTHTPSTCTINLTPTLEWMSLSTGQYTS